MPRHQKSIDELKAALDPPPTALGTFKQYLIWGIIGAVAIFVVQRLGQWLMVAS